MYITHKSAYQFSLFKLLDLVILFRAFSSKIISKLRFQRAKKIYCKYVVKYNSNLIDKEIIIGYYDKMFICNSHSLLLRFRVKRTNRVK